MFINRDFFFFSIALYNKDFREIPEFANFSSSRNSEKI